MQVTYCRKPYKLEFVVRQVGSLKVPLDYCTTNNPTQDSTSKTHMLFPGTHYSQFKALWSQHMGDTARIAYDHDPYLPFITIGHTRHAKRIVLSPSWITPSPARKRANPLISLAYGYIAHRHFDGEKRRQTVTALPIIATPYIQVKGVRDRFHYDFKYCTPCHSRSRWGTPRTLPRQSDTTIPRPVWFHGLKGDASSPGRGLAPHREKNTGDGKEGGGDGKVLSPPRCPQKVLRNRYLLPQTRSHLRNTTNRKNHTHDKSSGILAWISPSFAAGARDRQRGSTASLTSTERMYPAVTTFPLPPYLAAPFLQNGLIHRSLFPPFSKQRDIESQSLQSSATSPERQQKSRPDFQTFPTGSTSLPRRDLPPTTSLVGPRNKPEWNHPRSVPLKKHYVMSADEPKSQTSGPPDPPVLQPRVLRYIAEIGFHIRVIYRRRIRRTSRTIFGA